MPKFPVSFNFDKMVWSLIFRMKPDERRTLQLQIDSHTKEGNILVAFSPVNLMELIDGLDEKTFEKCRAELQIASGIANKCFLEDPWDHVRRVTANIFGITTPLPNRNFIDLCFKIANSKQYEDIKYEVENLKSYVKKFEDSWLESTVTTKDFALSLGESKLQQFRRPEVADLRLLHLWKAFCTRFPVVAETKSLSVDQALGKLPSFREWVDVHVIYQDQMIFEGRNPKKQDYLDLEQVVYLNIIDYFVTEEKWLRRLIKQTNNIGLKDRFITLNEFRTFLAGPLPPKRAMEPIDRI